MIPKKAPNETDVLVGARVRLRRAELGLSQTTLGEKLGVTFQQVQKYEKGTNRIGASRLLAIAGVLDVPVGYFFPKGDEVGAGEQAQPAEILDLLSVRGAIELLRDYMEISDPAARKALRVLVTALANASRDESNAESQAAH